MKFAMKDNAFALASKAKRLALGHSKSYAKKCGWPVSDLCLPDKASILFDPAWFYILRGKLSGEIHEYVYNSPGGPNQTARQWFCWYHQNVRTKVYLHTHTNTL